MNININDLNTANNLLGYYNFSKELNPEKQKLNSIFPVKKILGLDYSYIKGTGGISATLSPSSMDSEAIIIDRGSYDQAKGELALFKNKKSMREEERQKLYTLLQISNQADVNTKMAEIFDDEKSLIESAIVTQEYLRARTFAEGKITMDYDGGKIDVNYGYVKSGDKQNFYDLAGQSNDWNVPSTDIIGMISNWSDRREEATGVRPDTIWMNSITLDLFRKNDMIISYAELFERDIIARKNLELVVKEILGINVVIYNDKVNVNGVQKNLIQDYEIVLMPSSVNLGDLLVGTSPTEFNRNDISNIADVTVSAEGIAISKWSTVDPINLFTGVEMVCLPSFPGIDYCVSSIVSEKPVPPVQVVYRQRQPVPPVTTITKNPVVEKQIVKKSNKK